MLLGRQQLQRSHALQERSVAPAVAVAAGGGVTGSSSCSVRTVLWFQQHVAASRSIAGSFFGNSMALLGRYVALAAAVAAVAARGGVTGTSCGPATAVAAYRSGTELYRGRIRCSATC